MPSIQKRQRRLWIWSTIVVALLILFFRALERRELKPATVLLEGQTMGTTWHIRLGDWPAVLDDSSLKEKLQREIDAVLVRISASLSAWDERSVLSAFNGARADSVVEMDEDFQRVLEAARRFNYLPNVSARRLATGRAGAVGVVLQSNRSLLLDPHYAEFLAGLGERFA